MKNIVALIAALSLTGAAFAGGNPHCPKCKMELSSKKTKMDTVAVKMNGKTYYCCAACGAHKVAKVTSTKTKAKPMTAPGKGH